MSRASRRPRPRGRGASARPRPCGARRGSRAARRARASGPSRMAPHRSPVALLARQQVDHRAAEQQRVRAAGRERRLRALAQAPGDGRAHVRGLAREPLRRALGVPGVAQPAGHPPRPRRRREAGLAHRHRAAGEQPRGREHQHLERALDVGRALRQQPRREDVQLALPRPADDVAARRRGGQPPLQRQPRLRRVELGGRAVQHDRQLADLDRRAAPRAARARARAARARAPRRRASRSSWRATKVSDAVSTHTRSTFAGLSRHAMQDADHLLVRGPVDPRDQRLGRGADRAELDRVVARLVAVLARLLADLVAASRASTPGPRPRPSASASSAVRQRFRLPLPQ